MVATAMTEDQLDGLIGRQVVHQGRTLQVLDWLVEGPVLVLQDLGPATRIQDDQFGEARRLVPPTWSVPVYDSATGDYHPLVRNLGLI